MEEKEEKVAIPKDGEKVWYDLLEVGRVFQDLEDPDAQCVIVIGTRAYVINMQLLKNRLLKFNTEIFDVTDMRWDRKEDKRGR